MKRQVFRSLMNKMDRAWFPMIAKQSAGVAPEDTDREFDRLVRWGTRFDDQFFADGNRFAHILDVHSQGFVQEMPVFSRGQQYLAQRALVREQDIDHTSTELLPGLGHLQRESRA